MQMWGQASMNFTGRPAGRKLRIVYVIFRQNFSFSQKPQVLLLKLSADSMRSNQIVEGTILNFKSNASTKHLHSSV